MYETWTFLVHEVTTTAFMELYAAMLLLTHIASPCTLQTADRKCNSKVLVCMC